VVLRFATIGVVAAVGYYLSLWCYLTAVFDILEEGNQTRLMVMVVVVVCCFEAEAKPRRSGLGFSEIFGASLL